jgi:protocatechuate 3,4-dioxygenase beta subunit
MRTDPFLNRREFIRGASIGMVTFTGALALVRNGWALQTEDDPAKAAAGGPANPSWNTVLISADEPGEPLIVSGTIYADDGRTPIEGARLYVYQTDAKGYYVPRFSLKRTARIRGWMKTGADGRYEFRTIKPGAYPGNRIAAHIHATLSAAGRAAQWIDDFLFDGDPFLTQQEIAKAAGKGAFSHILKLERGADGVLRARRDLRLRAS